MSVFSFVSHEFYPEDPYISEACTLCLEGKYRVIFIRKKNQNGAMWWDEISANVKQNGEKKYLRSFYSDSNFLKEDIMHYLNSREWEKKEGLASKNDQLPF